MRNIIPISGKDSLATMLVQHQINPGLKYEYIFNPTGLELPEVDLWINKVDEYLGVGSIVKCGENLEAIIKDKHNYFLPSQKSRYCTNEAKIQPFIKYIGKDECTVYYGIRADENRGGFDNSRNRNIKPAYPLKDLGIDLKMVYQIVNHANLKPPTFFWEGMYLMVKERLDFDPKLVLSEWHFDMLFSWRSRANCDRCFNQRLYEWVGLLEFHPDRFCDAETYEHLGSDGIFTWNSNKKSLLQISIEKDRIKEKRADDIVKFLRMGMQTSLFQSDIDENFFDVLSVTSCGLFCGK